MCPWQKEREEEEEKKEGGEIECTKLSMIDRCNIKLCQFQNKQSKYQYSCFPHFNIIVWTWTTD